MAPAHGTLSVLGEASKDFVVISSYIVTYGYHCAVNECYTRTLTEGIELFDEITNFFKPFYLELA